MSRIIRSQNAHVLSLQQAPGFCNRLPILFFRGGDFFHLLHFDSELELRQEKNGPWHQEPLHFKKFKLVGGLYQREIYFGYELFGRRVFGIGEVDFH